MKDALALPPNVEPRPCGGCLHFVPDATDPEGQGWGRCAVRGHSVTRRMRVVLNEGERTCYQDFSTVGMSKHRLTRAERIGLGIIIAMAFAVVAFAVEFIVR